MPNIKRTAMFIDKAKAPSKIINKAIDLLKAFTEKVINARKSKKYGYLILEVGRRFRLLCKNGKWFLLTHEQYNREIIL